MECFGRPVGLTAVPVAFRRPSLMEMRCCIYGVHVTPEVRLNHLQRLGNASPLYDMSDIFGFIAACKPLVAIDNEP